ncbi:DUF2975 domain-containing protein [Paenibacillus faecalis]|uniref:DUF2975 domain-containing protein n=1 Tax=Paenibacillus faecalis TaxID=2079532 RepID=UPI00131A49E5|nr:DUF2975 domain-containing protein [Paenibacillus faecalis]
MNPDVLKQIKMRSNKIMTFMNLIIGGTIVFIVAAIGLLIWASFVPQESFQAEKGVAHWLLSVKISDHLSFSSIVPFSILQPLSTDRFQAKTAFITFLLSRMLIFMPVFLYGLKQIKNILLSITDTHTPFAVQNATRFRNLSYAVIGYSLLGNLILNLSIIIFVTNIFSIQLTNISLTGLMIGLLLMIVSHIFRYGAYLQEEYDSTL